jgi:hypothetical protein
MDKVKPSFISLLHPRTGDTVLGLIVLYIFFAFLPLPQGPVPGLDPSWQYALSRAAGENLAFGRDIVFTYGKLGYLLVGSATSENYVALLAVRFFIHTLLIGAVFLKFVEMSSQLQKLLLIGTLLCGYWSGFLRSSDGEIFFCVAILLTLQFLVHPMALRWWAMPFGLLAGFCLLTKLTLGAYVFGALLLFLLGNLYSAIRTDQGVEIALATLANTILFGVGSCYILTGSPSHGQLETVCLCLAFGVALGAFGFVLGTLLGEQKVGQPSRIGWYGFYVGSLVALVIFCTTTPLFTEYFAKGLEISSGYSSAMAITGSIGMLALALVELLAVGVFVVVSVLHGRLSFALASAWMLFLTFKAAFVRADWIHASIFLALVPLVFLLLLDQSQEGRWRIGLWVAQGTALAGIFLFTVREEGVSVMASTLQPFGVYERASAYLHQDQTLLAVLQESNKKLQGERLPLKILETLRDRRVDVFPWELSIMAINPLHWAPRPTLQSYLAYTPALDAIDQINYQLHPRDYIVYHYDSIDARHPFFDEPNTFFELLCWYGPVEPEVRFLPLTLQHAFLLKHRSTSACSKGTRLPPSSITWEETVVLPDQPGKLTRAYFKVEYSLLGKLTKAFFRVPEVWLNVTYMDGTSKKLHILQETAQDGLILSHPTRNAEEAFRLFQGKRFKGVRTFFLTTKAPYLFTNKIRLDIEFTPFQVHQSPKPE